jgi:hypothetical protein
LNYTASSLRKIGVGRKKPGAVNRALCILTLPCLFLWIRFFCAGLFFLVGLFFLGSAVFFGIQLNLRLVNSLIAVEYFFPLFHVVLSEAATVQPEQK